MPDPADKSDDLIAELAKLMATAPAGNPAAVQPIARPAPLNPNASSPAAPAPAASAPTPFRIPGMDAPRPAAAAPVAPPQAEPRAPTTGSIRIPGMDQPAPVSTSAPVSKFDFGTKPAMAPIKQEPLSSFSERLAVGQSNLANDPAPAVAPPPAPIRIPSDLKPVSENRSFAEGPALSVSRPAPAPMPVPSVAPPPPQAPAPEASGSDFNFDFGFGQNPPASASPPRPIPQPRTGPPPSADPIAALIEADMALANDEPPEAHWHGDLEDEADEHEHQDYQPESEAEPESSPTPARAPVVTPMIRAAGASPVPQKPTLSSVSSGQPRPPAAPPIPLKPVSVAPRAADNDRFAISPGVGLNVRPPANQPLNPQPRAPQPPAAAYDDTDPMSEIESLIGEAVRVELTPGPVRVQTPQQVSPKVQLEQNDDVEREIKTHPQASYMPSPAPVVPPLTTAFAPRRSNIKDDAGAASAEDAILAAAAASGAEVGRLEPAIGDESPYRRLKVKPQRNSMLSGGLRQYVGMAVAGTLLLAAGLGLYWVLNMGRGANTATSAPQLTADPTPVKVKPAQSATPATDTAKSPVLAKMDGSSAAPSSEQLVSTDETSGGTVARDVTPTADADGGESGLANRKVRTVTVRPDGTIVSGDDALAGGTELPVDRPNVPSVPSTESTNLLGSGDGTQLTAAPADATAAPALTNPTAEVANIDPTVVAPTPMSLPTRSTAATTPLAPKPPANTTVNAATTTGAQTPNGQIDLLGESADPQVAAAQPQQTVAPAASGGSAPAYVQLSSQPTQGDAQAAVKAMNAKYGALFGGNKLTIQQVDLGQKGVKWRVRLPAASLADATSICAQIKSQGGDCFPTKG